VLVRLGVLTNPVADHNHRFPFTHGRLQHHLESEADAVVTADKSCLDEAVRQLLLEREVTVLAINGGDGTIHGVVNCLSAAFGEDYLAGRRAPPTLLLLNGGTYNMASRAMSTNGDPVATVRRFQHRFRGGHLASVPSHGVGLLEVRGGAALPMLGMFFGSQVVANALDLCDRMGSGYLGLVRLLGQGAAGYVLRTAFFRENAWRLRADDPRGTVDGVPYRDVVAMVAATVDMKLARGLVWALTAPTDGAGFHVKLVRGRRPGDVVHLLPHLLWELSHPMIVSFPEARAVTTSGAFTLDGELYEHRGPLEIGLSPLRFEVVSGDAL